jgi:ABC-type transport system involved in multi-copper enzyme maturation permease subunit
MVLSKIVIIAYYTMKEILKSKILVNVFLVGLAMMVLTFVAAEFTYGVPGKIALDFGLSMLWFSSCGIALFTGVSLISKEIDSRTVYMVISRPVPRYAFVLGKIAGLSSVLLINVFLLSAMTLISTSFLGGELNSLVWWTLLYTIVESILLLLVVILFSMTVNNVLCVSLLLLVSGHAIRETQNIQFVQLRPFLKGLVDLYHLILPGFYKLNLKDYVLYNQSLSSEYLWTNLIYGILYSLFVLFVILFLFNRKNLD